MTRLHSMLHDDWSAVYMVRRACGDGGQSTRLLEKIPWREMLLVELGLLGSDASLVLGLTWLARRRNDEPGVPPILKTAAVRLMGAVRQSEPALTLSSGLRRVGVIAA